MLGWLKDLFSSGDKGRGKRMVEDTRPPVAGQPDPYLRREVILDRQLQVVAYAFSVAMPESLQGHGWQAASRRFFDEALLDHFADGKASGLPTGRLAVLPLGLDGLLSSRTDALPGRGMVVEFAPPPAAYDDVLARWDEVLAKLRQLRQQGIALSCGHYLGTQLPEALALAQYISLGDVMTLSPADLLARCRDLTHNFPAQALVAYNVVSPELYHACQKMGVQWFQGHFLTQATPRQDTRIPAYRVCVMDMLNGIKRQADFDELVEVARRDPALAYRLLRFVNSAAFNPTTRISDLKNALVFVGRSELYRWLTLLLFNSQKPQPRDAALRETALVRARFMESLAEGRLPPKEKGEVFVVGILSVIDALMDLPMDQVLAQLSLPDAIPDALLRRQGRYADYLKLALACEEGNAQTIADLGQAVGTDAESVNRRHLDALIWSVRFSGLVED